MTTPTHVLFDFFGTLVEYSQSRVDQGFEKAHHVLQSAGAQLDYQGFLDRWEAMFQYFDNRAQHDLIEFSMDDVCGPFLASVTGTDPGARLVSDFRDTYLEEWNKGVRHIPGVAEMISALAHRFTLVLVTNTHHADLVREHLKSMGASACFSAVVTSVEHGKRKPHQSIFMEGLRRVGGTPDAAVYIGDSFSSDYLGARAAGLRCLLIDPEHRHNVVESDRVAHILEVPARLGGPGRANGRMEPPGAGS